MREIKKTVITVESVQRTTIRQRRTAKIALCDRCAAEMKGNAAAQIPEPCSPLSLPEGSKLSDAEIENQMLSHHSAPI